MDESGGKPDEHSAEVAELREQVAELERVVADRERFRLIFEHAPDAVYVNDLKGTFIDGNPAAEQLIGYEKEELIGGSFLQLGLLPAFEIPRAAAVLAKNAVGKSSGPDEFTLIRKDGARVPIEAITFPVTVEGKTLVVGFARDLTARKEFELEVRQSQKMEAIGQLAGGIAHDFNNLLMAINGHAQLVLDNMDDDDPQRARIDQIISAGDHAASLTRQLLAFSRRQPLEFGLIDMNAMMREAINLVARIIPENIDIKLVEGPEYSWIQGDAAQILQVLINLSVNAKDAMPGGGALTIKIDRVDSGGPPANVVVTITDTGHGMDEETQRRVFDPFFTTKDVGEGTGMGLATAYGIIKQHGGEIDLWSEEGGGTRFRICLPATDHHQREEAEAVDDPAPPPGSGELVLVVEDDEQVRTIVAETLERRGYEVLAAGNTDDAGELLEELGDDIDLLVTDVILPGKSGTALYQLAAAKHPALKVLYMSGYAPAEQRVDSDGAAPEPLLRKPFRTSDLATAVRDVLDA